MATRFSFVINKELSEEQQKQIAHILGSSMLRSEDWYKDGEKRCALYQNYDQAGIYSQMGKTANDISRAVGACGEYMIVEEV